MTTRIKQPNSNGADSLGTDNAPLTFLAHDIRSAVFDVIGGLRLIEEDELPTSTRQQIDRVRASGETLARLVEDALTLITTEMHAGPDITPNLHLRRLLNDMRLRWAGRANANDTTFQVNVSPEVPAVIATIRLNLERVLSNLISNALKYTEDGLVKLDVSVTAAQELCFVVSDTGSGFSKEALEKLYQFQGRPSGQGKPGTGLGLHIAKNIADDMGGKLTVKNTDNGALVSLLLPAQIWQYEAEKDTPKYLIDLSNIRVLLADDNDTNQLVIAQMLKALGAEFEIASDGVEAINWLEREDFDIAFVDIDMPRLSGLEVMRYARASKSALRKLPILAITAFVMREDRDKIYEAGADRILAKPIMATEDLAQAVALLLPNVRIDPAPVRPSPPVSPEDTNDMSQLNHLLDLAGKENADELLSRLQTDLRDVDQGIANATQPVSCNEIRAHSHVLISLSGAVDAQKLMQMAMEINTAAHSNDEAKITEMIPALRKELSKLCDIIQQEAMIRSDNTGKHDG
ncbi:response regulator [Cochlodiniinecator piscidefendens]|uniref:response regulator n=1 Tax=Cochlodiniinecator piscidefendens TaxID=2715756 RepID=UPI00140D290D|nr:response regulator [Cochlodiniinecator piscidefendens]